MFNIYLDRKKIRIFAWFAVPLYILGVAYFTLFWKTGGFAYGYHMKLNLIPLFWLWEPLKSSGKLYMDQVLLNILLFMPLGGLQLLIKPSSKIKTIFVTAMISTLSIESIQPFFGRCTDVDDVLLNIGGALLGYALLKVFTKKKAVYRKKKPSCPVVMQGFDISMDSAA